MAVNNKPSIHDLMALVQDQIWMIVGQNYHINQMVKK